MCLFIRLFNKQEMNRFNANLNCYGCESKDQKKIAAQD